MKIFQKPIFTGFMPNLLSKDVLIAASFFLPWNFSKLQKGEASEAVKHWLQNFFQIPHVTLFDSGRTSLYFALKALGVQKDDEVLMQAYTCAVVSNSVTSIGATPIYIDIKDDFTLDPQKFEQKITSKSKVIIIQHTFGIPADLPQILALAKKYNIKVIEDCAHTLGGTFQGQKLGTFGDIAMLSFGADKAVSCGRGGATITCDPKIAKFLDQAESELPHFQTKKVYQQLLTFIIFYFSKPFYNLKLGKIKLALAKKLRFLSPTIYPQEKRGETVPFYPSKLPNSLCQILLHQLTHLEQFNEQRKQLTKEYIKKIQNPHIVVPSVLQKDSHEIILLRFPILVSHPEALHAAALKKGIMLGDWYNRAVAPKDVILEKMQYNPGTCPRAEFLASRSVNLPTHIGISNTDREKIITLLNKYQS